VDDDVAQGGDATPDGDVTQDDESSQMRFARYLDELISSYFYSRAALARGVGVTESTIRAWRTGLNCPGSQRLAMRLADVLENHIKEQGGEFDREQFMRLWVAADNARSQRKARRPDEQPSDIDSPVEPDSPPPVEDSTPRASDSLPNRRRTMVILVLAIVAAASLLYVAVNWGTSPQAGAPTQSSATTIGPLSPTLFLYRIDANPATGAHVHELPQGSSVDQQFRATAPKIVRFPAIIGSDAFPDGAIIGKVQFQLLDCTTVRVDRTVDALNNIDTLVTLDSPVQVNPGQMCTLRVTNLAQRTLGFFFNHNPNLENQTVLHGAVDPPGASTQHEHALSGHVLGQSP
jgi:hypothetical protein